MCSRASVRAGRHFEEIADDAIIGDFENRGVRVLVDCNDGACALHPDDVLDGAGDADRDVQLRRDGLAGAADLALHGQPPRIADGTRRRELRAERRRELLRRARSLLALDPAADRHDALRLRQVDRSLRLLKRRVRLLPDRGRIDGRLDHPHGRRAAPGRLVRAKRADLKLTRHGVSPSGTTSAASLPWNIGRVNAVRRFALDGRCSR